MHALLIASICVISMSFAPWGTVHAMGDAVKWHPGHYYMIDTWGKNNPQHLAEVYRELKETPALRGMQIRYKWSELEPSMGNYDFTSIDQRLAELAAQNKRLIILVQTKSFKPEDVLVPDYLKAERFEGGIFAFSRSHNNVHKGHNIKLWNNQVGYRLIKLFRAMGERYNSHPYFEGIGLTETAMGKPMIAISNDQFNNFYNNLIFVNKRLRESFPNTMTYQFTNFPNVILKQFTRRLKNMGTALAGPDIFIEEPGLNLVDHRSRANGVYSYYPELSGIVPLAQLVEGSNYVNTKHDETGYKPTVWELLAFGRNKLKANYIFWTRDPEHYEEVLQVLNWKNQTSDRAGGLDSTCPSKYSSCVRN